MKQDRLTYGAQREFVIEDNIPMPSKRIPLNKGVYPFGKMTVGQSFLVPTPKGECIKRCQALSASARGYGRRNGEGKKFAVRTLKDCTGVRVWRTA